MQLIEIDGSFGEGGGQIVRNAVAFSALTGKAVRITNIRAKRPNPGLNWQHLTAIDSVRKLCNATTYGLERGSSTLEFRPSNLVGGKFKFEVGTAGSITLVLQACLLPALFCKNETQITITGGTDVAWSPPIDYFRFVFLQILKKMGAEVDIKLIRRGYYPRGGGAVEVRIQPLSKLTALKSERGKLKNITGYAHITNLPAEVLHRLCAPVYNKLSSLKTVYEIIEKVDEYPAYDRGAAIVLRADFENTTIGASQLGQKGVRAEKLGGLAVEELVQYLNTTATVDIYAADQILPYLALCNEKSEMKLTKVTMHTATSIELVKKFTRRDVSIIEGPVKRICIH